MRESVTCPKLMSSLPRVPPSSVDYSKLLPLGVKGVSKARKFQPNNGSTFTSTNPVIRIPLNSTGFLDTQHSYLSFKCTFTKSDGNNSAIDGGGQGVIRQLKEEKAVMGTKDAGELQKLRERAKKDKIIAIANLQRVQREQDAERLKDVPDARLKLKK